VTVYATIDDLLDQAGVDGVLIGTRCSSHAALAARVLDRHLPLFLEKPVGTTWDSWSRSGGARGRAVQSSSPSGCRVSARRRGRSPAAPSAPSSRSRRSTTCPSTQWLLPRLDARRRGTGGLWLQKATRPDYLTYLIDGAGQPCALEPKTVFQARCRPAAPRRVRRQGVPESPTTSSAGLTAVGRTSGGGFTSIPAITIGQRDRQHEAAPAVYTRTSTPGGCRRRAAPR
jgi:hypothetical protein